MKRLWLIISSLVFWSAVSAQTSFESDNNQASTETFITAQGLGINSIGEFKENWVSGSGFYLGYGIIYSDNGSLLFQTGSINFKANDDAGYNSNSIFRLTPFMVGGRYYIIKEWFRPFLQGMSGLNVISQDWATADTSLASTGWHLAFQVGVGLDIMLFSGLQLELAAKYNSHLFEPPKPYNITGLEYNVGLVWRLSGPDK